MVGTGMSGTGNSTYSHLISMMPRESVFRSKLPSVPKPVFTAVVAAAPELLMVESFDPAWPYTWSSSIPSTPLALPTSPMKSKRPRVRMYHMLSPRLKIPPLKLLMFCEYEVTLSMRPLMVTFGAGAWAKARGAARATMAKAIIRTARLVLFIRLPSIRSMTCNLLHLALSDFPLCAQRRYGWRDECFSLSPPRKRRMGKRVTFLPRIIFGGQGKSRRPFLDLQQVKSAT